PARPTRRGVQARPAHRDRRAAARPRGAAAGRPVRVALSGAAVALRDRVPASDVDARRPHGELLGRSRPRGAHGMMLQGVELRKYFSAARGLAFGRSRGWIKALDGVSLQVAEGETLGIVGESGWGKTTPARLILPP